MPNISGAINGTNNSVPFSYQDSCTPSGEVVEHHCIGASGAHGNIPRSCYPGTCQNGQCILTATCTDSDGGINYNVAGNVSGMNLTTNLPYVKFDYCWNGRAYEYVCTESYPVIGGYRQCQNGCSNGVCTASTPTCQDTDGGVFPYVFGVISGMNINGSNYSIADSCSGSNYLNEGVCDPNPQNGNYSTIWTYCSFGCSNGICNTQQTAVYCGDGICQSNETQNNCVADCVTPLGNELLGDKGFEAGQTTTVANANVLSADNFMQWGFVSSSSVATYPVHSGAYSGMLDDPGAAAVAAVSQWNYGGQETYVLKGWAYNGNGAAPYMYLEFYNDNNVRLSESHVQSTAPIGQWRLLGIQATAPAGTTKVRALLYSCVSCTGLKYFDDISLKPLAAP